jgi:hypothetical protein
MGGEMHPGSPDLDEVRRVIRRGLAGRRARVYLFGSWARGEASRVSDIDVAVLPGEPLPPGLLAEIQEDLENSTSLYPVDLIDLTGAPEPFRSRVLAEGVPWIDLANASRWPAGPSMPSRRRCGSRRPP